MYFDKNSLFFLNLSLCLFVVTNCYVCNEKAASYYSTSISITCIDLTHGFPEFQSNVQTVLCYDCNLPVLDETTNVKTFRGSVFNLTNSHINQIEATAFKFFTNSTRRFIFDDNEITYIAPNAFSNFTMTSDLCFRNNKLSNNGSKLFVKTNATNIDLSYNHLTTIDDLFFELRVFKLNLSHNDIKELPANTFRQVEFWGGRQHYYDPLILVLSHNYISEIVVGSFKFADPQSAPRIITLSHNRLTRLGNQIFVDLPFLTTLDLEGNRISELEPHCFKGLLKLTKLVLSDNQIQNIPPNVFLDLDKLDSLDLSRNNLKSLNGASFNGLLNLNTLNISHNDLKVLKENDLVVLGKLTRLDISDLKLHDLNLQSILEQNLKLSVLVVNDNFWTCKGLMDMYKLLNQKANGFSWLSNHYDVPNLHGIACSRSPIASYDDLSFQDFLGIISKDRFLEDFYDKKTDDVEIKIHQEIIGTMRNLRELYYLVLVLLIIVVIVFAKFVVRNVYVFVYNRKIEGNGRMSYF